MDAATRKKAIKDATANGHFNVGAYAGNLVKAATPPPPPTSTPTPDSTPMPTRAPIAPIAQGTPSPHQQLSASIGKKTNRWSNFVNTIQANSAQIQSTIPSVGLTSARTPIPIFQLNNVFSFGTVTSHQSALDGNPILRYNRSGGALVGGLEKVSGFVSVDPAEKKMTYGVRYSGTKAMKENDLSANIGYSAITTLQVNQIWNASASLDINFQDVSVKEEGVTKGNVRAGVYYEVRPATLLAGAVVLVGALKIAPALGGSTLLRQIPKMLPAIFP